VLLARCFALRTSENSCSTTFVNKTRPYAPMASPGGIVKYW
jgi:hypothetical protein